MWVYTITEDAATRREVDVRFETRDEAASSFNMVYRERPDSKAKDLREEPEDYVPIEERNASPELFPPGVTCRSQLPPR